MKSLFFALSLVILSAQAMATDYDKIVSKIKEFSARPHTSIFSLGKNDQGQDILGLIVGDASTAKIRHLLV